MKTHLNIYILPETDARFLSIADRSIYNTDLEVKETSYLITPPGFTYPVQFAYVPNQVLTVNTNLLNITNTSSYETLSGLPDGIYLIKQQMCPVDQLFAEYFYMRTTKLEQKLNRIRCSYKPTDVNLKEATELRKTIMEIDFYITQSKAAAESCGNSVIATDFYKKASHLIEDTINKCNC